MRTEGADLAVVPLAELIASYERLHALDLHVFFVSGWSQGRDTLAGTALAKPPPAGTVGFEVSGGADALALALQVLDLAGIALDRLKIDERAPEAMLHATHREAGDVQSPGQENVIVSTQEAARLLPYVLVAPRPLLDEREAVVAAFVEAARRLRRHRCLAPGPGQSRTHRGGRRRRPGCARPAPFARRARTHSASLRTRNSSGSPDEAPSRSKPLVDRNFRVRRATHLGRTTAPEQPFVDGRVVTRIVRAHPKLVRAPEPRPRRLRSDTTPSPLLARPSPKDDDAPLVDAIGFLAAVFPRSDVRLSRHARPASVQTVTLDRASERYDIDRARLVAGASSFYPGTCGDGRSATNSVTIRTAPESQRAALPHTPIHPFRLQTPVA